MKLSDYVLEAVAAAGASHVFMVPGGAAMHLNDSLAASQRLRHTCFFHEQAACVAAEAFAKARSQLGVAMVTAGPGSTNAVTGVASAWVNSAPLLVLAGQVKSDDLNDGKLRQSGLQEIAIDEIVRPITKYVATIRDPSTAQLHVRTALAAAVSGRPGPVWLTLPLDVQAAAIELSAQVGVEKDRHFDRAPHPHSIPFEEIIRRLNAASRPICLAGYGIRAAGAQAAFMRLMSALQIPVQTTWIGCDLIDHTDPLYAGRPGSFASRAANFAIQNADFVLALGARLDFATTGYSRERFARTAFKVAVDIDPAEIEKHGKTISAGVVLDADAFIAEMLERSSLLVHRDRSEWFQTIRRWEARYPLLPPVESSESGGVSTYRLVQSLSRCLATSDVIVEGSSGIHSEIFFMAFEVKAGQRVIADGSFGSMGYGLPAAIGACIATNGLRTILVEGDGSLQPQLQELETIRREALPIKIIVVNNDGFASIRVSQSRYFGRLIGADATSGLTIPNLKDIAAAYGIAYHRIDSEADLEIGIASVLNTSGPTICEVMVPREEDRVPRVANVKLPDGKMVSRPMEDMFPFLGREEFLANMIIDPLPDEPGIE